jgi:uncharacterized phage infection (PIP) family protein YhgE
MTDSGGAKRSQSQQSAASPGANPRSYGRAETPYGAAERRADQVSDLARRVQAGVLEAVEPAKQRAKTLAEDQKAAGADKLKQVAQAIDNAAGNLEGELPMTAKTIREAAAGLEQVSANLKNRSVEDLTGTVASFARSQPVAFFGGAVLAGIVLARFLKSSPER